MARLPESEIERLKTDVSLLRLIQAQGRKVTKQGKDYATLCPFHDEKTPSLIISPNKNLYHCFGCNAGGTVIDWVMKTEGVSFRHAAEMLLNEVPLSNSGTALKDGTTTKKLDTLSADPDHQALLRRVFDYYHETLKQNAEALEYLSKRGLNHPELIDTFKLGYANRTLAYKLPNKNRVEGGKVRGQLQALGILRESGHEHFNGSLVIPIMDQHGAIHEAYGRKIQHRLRKGTPLHCYLPGPHKGVFNISGFKTAKAIILCEALIDALTFWANGFRNVTACYGVHGFTDELLQAIIEHGIEKVLIAFDRDDAGDRAAEKIAKTLNEHGIDAFRVLFPKGMDANEYAVQVTPAQKSLELVVRNAQWIGSAQRDPQPEESETPMQKQFKQTLQTVAEQVEEISQPVSPSLVADPGSGSGTSLPDEADIEATIEDHEITFNFDDRRYRVRGLEKNTTYDQLKINLLISRDEALHVDTLDLYSARQRQAYTKQACIELGVTEDVLKTDIGKVLLKLEALQDQQIKDALKIKSKALIVDDEDAKAAMNLLKAPDLLQRILDDFNRAGVVGEETNKLVGYLSCVSRKLEKPLAVMIQSSSAAGKSSLMDAVLKFMPEEERVQYSAMTGQSLFYMGETNLKNKILAIAEEEGAQNASYALKLLQSDGELTIASTGKNDITGNLETREYRVEGPVMIFFTTTAIDIDEELMNRCIVLSVDESREQTRAIHAIQRHKRTLEGILQRSEKQHIVNLHNNAQRLLRPLHVSNPFAKHLTFIDDKTRARRDQDKYLTLIECIALLHQHQREVKTGVNEYDETIEYVEAALNDIDVANRLAHEVLGKTLDELPPQTRNLLSQIYKMVVNACRQQRIEQKDYRFSRKDIRMFTGWSDGQLKIHCHRLEEMEYIIAHGGGRGKLLQYELLYDGQGENGELFFMGLMDVHKLREIYQYDEKKSGQNGQKSGSSQAQVRAKSGPSQGKKKSVNTANKAKNKANGQKPSKTQCSGENKVVVS